MNSNRWKMYTYAVQRCQNEKKTLLFVLMESKGEEDIWRSCLQFSLSTRKKGGQKLRHSFLSRFSTPFPVSSKLWKNVIAHRAPHSKTVNQNWCMKSKKSWKKHFNCSKITVLLRKKVFLGTFTQWLKIHSTKVLYYITREHNFVDPTTRGKLGITLMLLGHRQFWK